MDQGLTPVHSMHPFRYLVENELHYLSIYFPCHQDCHEDYDQTFAYGFNQYLIGIPNRYDKVHMYLQCIKQHFKCNNCPSDKCSELW